METMSLDGGGDIRFVHPNVPDVSGGARCEYLMYKNPEDIPEEYYARLNRKRPGVE